MTPADLKAIRESYQLSQADFARLLRIDRRTWYNWESGRTEPPAIAITALSMLVYFRQHAPLVLLDWMSEDHKIVKEP